MKEYNYESELLVAGGELNLQHYYVARGDPKQDWGIRDVSRTCHKVAVDSGWWSNPKTGFPRDADIPKCLMLIVSEIAEAMEGDRKSLMDDHLPHREMIEVELADAVIRIFDLAENLKLDVPGAMIEKMKYNRSREDHKPENRIKENGKKY